MAVESNYELMEAWGRIGAAFGLSRETDIPDALIDDPDTLASESYAVARREITWRTRLRELMSTDPGDLFLNAARQNPRFQRRLEIVQFFAGLETRRMETGSLR